MTSGQNEKLIFGRYTREECGLPPAGVRPWSGGLTVGRALLLLAAVGVLGWLGGIGAARWREYWLAALPSRIAAAATVDVSDLMARGRMYASALPENWRMRRDLAFACLAAAEKSPRRLGYYANAANLFRGVDAGKIPGGEVFATAITAAGSYAELGEYPEAFAALDRAETGLDQIPEEARRSFRLLLINTRAYFLAVAGTERGGDPEKALHLARLMISSRDPLPGGGHASGSAALLDTLATARDRTGDFAGATATQSLALGLADAQGLDVYLRHYDEFSKRKENGK